MNISQFRKALPVLLKHRIVPFVWGAQGIGKTQTIKQYAKANGLGFVHLHLATQEVGDLTGLLIHNDDKTVSHARPSWFPTEGEGIVFLDELNRANPEVISAMFSFITDGTIHTHKLPPGWRIVAAGNYQSNAFSVTDTSDAAWMSRFCHIDLNPTVEEFVLFAEEKGADSVASFIGVHREMLETEHKERLNWGMITPDRRSWLDFIAPLESEPSIEEIRYDLYCGLVGKTAAASFITFKTKSTERLSGKDILNNFEKVRNRIEEASADNTTRFDLLNSGFEEISTGYIDKNKTLSEKQMNNLKKFILAVPLELGSKIIGRISESSWSQKGDVLNNPDFIQSFKAFRLQRSATGT